MSEETKKKGYLVQAWLVLTLAVCFGASLAAVHIGLQPLIDENKRNETYSQIPELVKGAVVDLTEEVELGSAKPYTAYKAFSGSAEAKAHLGWVIKAEGQGFADKLELLVGLDRELKSITGLYVLSQKETPGLGNKIENPTWRGQFAGKDAVGKLKAVKKAPTDLAHDIKAVTGATVSSRSVCKIINAAVAKFRTDLAAAEKKD